MDGAPIEILDCKTHNRDWPKTEAELDEIVASYDPAVLEAPVKLDHQTQGGPAFGWVARIERQGSKLIAWLRDVAAELREAVRAGRYRNRSVELYKPGNDEPSFKGKPYLRALAFLGADVPASKGLAPIPENFREEIVSEPTTWLPAASGADGQADTGKEANEMADTPEKHEAALRLAEQAVQSAKGEVAKLSERVTALEAEKAKASEQQTALMAERDAAKAEVVKLQERIKAFEEAEKAAAQTAKAARCESMFNELLAAQKATPAEKESLVALFAALDEPLAKVIFETLKARPNVIALGQDPHDPARTAADGEAKRAEVARQMKVYMSEHPGATARDAMIAVTSKA